MADPLELADETGEAIRLIASEANVYLAELDRSNARLPGADEAAGRFHGSLPEEGSGAIAALQELIDRGIPAAVRSSGPRMFHFVTGGVTPAALGADWLASVLDQNAFSWVGSPLGSRLEAVTVGWLKELFRLPTSWGGVLTTGATMANFTALAAARRWFGERHGVDVEEEGLAGVPRIPVLAGGYLHTSVVKALAMLGIGRRSVRDVVADGAGRIDLDALEGSLRELGGSPAIVSATAGEVNAGDFDPIEAMADLAERHGAWLHVDGAFGLFARVTPRAEALAAGVERADSVIADGHKWLNVPYDSGFAFVRDPILLPKAFTASAGYLPSPDDPHPNFGYMGPEMSRRARALAAWASLRAYGRSGYRAMVERHLELAQRLAARVEAEPSLELLAEARLNIVCFRFRPTGVDGPALDEVNRRLGEAIVEDGRVYVGTTTYDGRVALRPAIVNWRTTERDIDALVEVVLELGAQVAGDL
ncbi:MAG TPA: pyridoxal-dependent decarboxylase [Actinomycetota bacterium]|nr:pyridoxal-dependent decarboxylase [Actinomycetota bacterium]